MTNLSISAMSVDPSVTLMATLMRSSLLQMHAGLARATEECSERHMATHCCHDGCPPKCYECRLLGEPDSKSEHDILWSWLVLVLGVAIVI